MWNHQIWEVPGYRNYVFWRKVAQGEAVGEETWEKTDKRSYISAFRWSNERSACEPSLAGQYWMQAQQYPCSAPKASLCLSWPSALRSRHVVKIRSFLRSLRYKRDFPSRLLNHVDIKGLASLNLTWYTVHQSNFRTFSTTNYNCEMRVWLNRRHERRKVRHQHWRVSGGVYVGAGFCGRLYLLGSLHLPSTTKSRSWSLPFRLPH
jgi:hypothetical protein